MKELWNWIEAKKMKKIPKETMVLFHHVEIQREKGVQGNKGNLKIPFDLNRLTWCTTLCVLFYHW